MYNHRRETVSVLSCRQRMSLCTGPVERRLWTVRHSLSPSSVKTDSVCPMRSRSVSTTSSWKLHRLVRVHVCGMRAWQSAVFDCCSVFVFTLTEFFWPSKLIFIILVILCMCILSLRNWISSKPYFRQYSSQPDEMDIAVYNLNIFHLTLVSLSLAFFLAVSTSIRLTGWLCIRSSSLSVPQMAEPWHTHQQHLRAH